MARWYALGVNREREKPRAKETRNPEIDKEGLHGALRTADQREQETQDNQERMELSDDLTYLSVPRAIDVAHRRFRKRELIQLLSPRKSKRLKEKSSSSGLERRLSCG